MDTFVRDLFRTLSDHFARYEVIFVDDGSTDGSPEILSLFSKNFPAARMLSYQPNRGKGYAVKTGVLAAQNQQIVFMDADGAIDPLYLIAMSQALETHAIVVADRSRGGLVAGAGPARKLLGWGFNRFVNLLFGLKLADTQCGFKGFQGPIAKQIFQRMKSERWIFDVEALYWARKLNLDVAKLPIEWQSQPGSKIKPLDPFRMALDVLKLRLATKS